MAECYSSCRRGHWSFLYSWSSVNIWYPLTKRILFDLLSYNIFLMALSFIGRTKLEDSKIQRLMFIADVGSSYWIKRIWVYCSSLAVLNTESLACKRTGHYLSLLLYEVTICILTTMPHLLCFLPYCIHTTMVIINSKDQIIMNGLEW